MCRTLKVTSTQPHSAPACVPCLAPPIPSTQALNKLVKSADYVGQALVPYYRQLLPVFNLFKQKNCQYTRLYWSCCCCFFLFFFFTFSLNLSPVNSGDGIDYHQRFSENIGDLIEVRVGLERSLVGWERVLSVFVTQPTQQALS